MSLYPKQKLVNKVVYINDKKVRKGSLDKQKTTSAMSRYACMKNMSPSRHQSSNNKHQSKAVSIHFPVSMICVETIIEPLIENP